MNNDIIAESQARANEIDLLKTRLDDLTLRSNAETRRLENEITRLQQALAKETNVDLRKKIDLDIGDVKSKVRIAEKKTTDIQEAKDKAKREQDAANRTQEVSKKVPRKWG